MSFLKHRDVLSKREKQIAEKILEGLPNKVIANQLFISERTADYTLQLNKWTA